jgi:riboflavin synthase
MFTGIIEELGSVYAISRKNNGGKIEIKSHTCYSDAGIGDSISVNGCCLTLIEKHNSRLVFDISQETFLSSNLSDLAQGELVNLERSLAPSGRLGGHFVTGHIDYAGRILSKKTTGEFTEFSIAIPDAFKVFFAEKGSVAVDGISLTVNRVSETSFRAMLIPHTLSFTTLKHKDKGSRVNIETDILAKYVQSFLSKHDKTPSPKTQVNKDLLSEHGFI